MYRLVPLPCTPLALGIAVIAACTIAAAIPGASALAEEPAAARAGVAGDADVLGAERLFSAWMEGQIEYSNLAYAVAGMIIEHVSGERQSGCHRPHEHQRLQPIR